MNKIGEILKMAREAAKMSQTEVAAKVRLLTRDTFSRSALSQIESGSTKQPKPQNLQAACDVFGIDFRSAMSGKLRYVTTKTKDPTENHYEHDKHVMEHLNSYTVPPNELASRAGGSPLDWSPPLFNAPQARKQREVAKTLTDIKTYMIGTIEVTCLAYKYVANGVGMTLDGINDGDILLIDPGVEPKINHVLLVELAGDQNIMRLDRIAGEYWLTFSNPAYADLKQPLSAAVVLGVVRAKMVAPIEISKL